MCFIHTDFIYKFLLVVVVVAYVYVSIQLNQTEIGFLENKIVVIQHSCHFIKQKRSDIEYEKKIP